MAQAGGMGEATQNMSQYTYKASLDSQDGLSPLPRFSASKLRE